MAKMTEVRGFIFTDISGIIYVSGSGIRGSVAVGNADSFNIGMFQGFDRVPAVGASAAEDLAAFTQSDIDAIKSGLQSQPPRVTETTQDVAPPTVPQYDASTVTLPSSGDEALQATQDQLVARQQQTAEPYTEAAATGDEALAATQQAEEASAARSIPNSRNPANSVNYETPPDWRVRLSLAPGAEYLYSAPNPGILRPLRATRGVVYPYTPQISVAYSATYDQQQITHSNYKFYTYQGSAVENITIAGDFTAQNVDEANYVLAVIHFFRSATKMFYGQDQNPSRGVPPPLLYLSGHGSYQFDNHPVVISSFNYSLPTDVDYINAYPDGASVGATGQAMTTLNTGKSNFTIGIRNSAQRLQGTGVAPGGGADRPQFPKNSSMIGQLTRVPTKISLSITLLPIITRWAASNKFSLRDYATGALLRGSKNPGNGGGMW